MVEKKVRYDLIVVVRPDRAGSDGQHGIDLAKSLSEWRTWSYSNYARIRWVNINYELMPGLSQEPFLVILCWNGDGAKNPRDVVAAIQEKWLRVPLVVTNAGVISEEWHQQVSPKPVVLRGRPELGFDGLLRDLGLTLSPVRKRLPDNSVDLAYRAVVGRVGEKSLDHIVEKFLADTDRVSPTVVSGGWSGDPVLRLQVTGRDAAEYYLKLAFFQRSVDAEKSIKNALNAQTWLGDKTVKLRAPIGGFRPNVAETLMEVFPEQFDEGGRWYVPLCWESASSTIADRQALSGIYQSRPYDFVKDALGAVIALLANGQSTGDWENREPAEDPARGSFLTNDYAKRAESRREMEDLQRYVEGSSWWQKRVFDFDRCAGVLGLSERPQILKRVAKVRVGHVHGDPNTRNILVNVEKSNDIVMIDCGAYRSDGFLVTDLARIEAELKLFLLDSDSDGYADIDPVRLENWISIERGCLEQKFALSEAFVDQKYAYLSESIRKAYKLIAMIRQAAKAVSDPHDKAGQHYFAALLCTTLRWLSAPHMRRPKRLLAIFSAAEILEIFDPKRNR